MFDLSICIPVFNRPESLKILLDSICLSTAYNKIQICISDNNTDNDCNKNVISEFEDKLKIKYIRNAYNVGMVKNILKSIELAEGKYIWLMGDDDYILGEKLSDLQGFIKNKEVEWFILPYVYMSNDYKYIYNSPFDENVLGSDLMFDDFVSKYLWLTGFIGANLFKRNAVRALSSREISVVENSYFPHVAFLAITCNKSLPVHIYRVPMSFNRSENNSTTTWSDKYFDVYWGWEKMLIELSSLTNNESFNKSIVTSRVLFNHRSVGWLVSRKADGAYNYDIYKKYYINEECNYRYFLVLFVPKFLAKILKSLIKIVPRLYFRKKTYILMDD